MNLGFAFYMTCMTSAVLILMCVYLASAKNKKPLHYHFITVVIQILVWTLAVILLGASDNNKEMWKFWEKFSYFGSATVPVALIFLGKAYSEKQLTKWYWLLYIVPIITLIIIWTNESHHLFYIQYAVDTASNENMYGWYFYIHAAYSYVLLLVGFVSLSVYAIKSNGILSSQAVLILIGSIIPTAANVLYTFKLLGFNVYSTPIAFSATLAMYLLGMFRFNLLKVSPIALQTVINRISDSFIVLDKDMNILDFNQTFTENFYYLNNVKKGANLHSINTEVGPNQLGPQQFSEMAKSVLATNSTIVKDVVSELNGVVQYYTVEITPIFQRNVFIAVILLFKNITQHILDVEKIKENQAILLERERLASLGQLIGGIAHNLKTPIMSIAGGIDQLQYLTKEYETSVGDPDVTTEDHAEIAQDMHQWLGKMKLQTGYMSDIISTVKDQASKFANPRHMWFTLDEMLKRVKILMQHEIVRNQCKFTQDIRMDKRTRIPGDVNSLVQILDNVIVNAIQSYDEQGGEIILQVTSEGNKLLITICDFGKGIDDKVKDRLFKEMITTKGKHGTGLGLYMSHSTVKGMFRGNMWFESSVGQGTKFYIQLPLYEEGAEVQDA